MGNINNPCINRWGVNSFWSHYWYSDNRYYQFIQQDSMFSTILKTYIHYGSDTPPKFVQDPLWYKNPTDNTKMKLHRDNRWFYVVEKDLGYSFSYIIRNEGSETFESRWVVLRFNKWCVISVSWFQPDKLFNKRRRKSQIVNHLLVTDKLLPLQKKKSRVYVRFLSSLRHHLPQLLETKESYLF